MITQYHPLWPPGIVHNYDSPAATVEAALEFRYCLTMSVAESLPSIEDQQAFNQSRWEELCADPFLASLDYRIETDHLGQIIMTPPAGYGHGRSQTSISELLKEHLPENGAASVECPISTNGGNKAADVVWISHQRLERSKQGPLLQNAPEICVEVLSPSNTRQEIAEKKRLYFEAGADEVWICAMDGSMEFFLSEAPDTPAKSKLAPEFPTKVDRIPD